eukprot:CAMPEP_0197846422 /NCGR_PEP_ID=MMETSP1438-20131217/3161_1 /TAXON_ID=1461541 /ORGANISM="Pterosperma sp., Strain CCMP1384" /LENGTH=215 /DNA_ID=CAMNT_0043458065 /DNA_START=180 /DNA_END=827 /DNA_ORIENTATION=-
MDHVDLGHQEMERIVVELEQVYQLLPNVQEQPWLSVEATALNLQSDLGYEDMGEFEDALSSTFYDFLKRLPHIEVRINDGKEEFRVKPDPPPEERKATTLTFEVKNRKDLYRMCVKATGAILAIPKLEFEIGADGKKHVDTLYNHISAAVFNLSMYSQQNKLTEDDKVKIAWTVDELTKVLDVDEPFTLEVIDQQGLSVIEPQDGVQVTFINEVD